MERDGQEEMRSWQNLRLRVVTCMISGCSMSDRNKNERVKQWRYNLDVRKDMHFCPCPNSIFQLTCLDDHLTQALVALNKFVSDLDIHVLDNYIYSAFAPVLIDCCSPQLLYSSFNLVSRTQVEHKLNTS